MHLPPTDSRPRVLHVTQPVDGGVARVVSDLTRAQLAAGLRVAVACPDGGLTAGLRALGADVRHWPATRSPGPALVSEVRRLARVIEEVRPDLVHAHSAKAGLAARLAVRGRVPTVFQPHAWSFEAVGGAAAVLALGWERWAARWAARTVCVSEAERLRGVRSRVRGRWTVIPNGIDLDRFDADAVEGVGGVGGVGGGGVGGVEAVDDVRLRLGAGVHGPLVVCVGRLCRQKGQDVLLTAWQSVLARVPGARLVLVGDGPDHARLADRASAYGFLGDGPARTRPGGHHPAPEAGGHATDPARPHGHATNPARPGGHHPASEPACDGPAQPRAHATNPGRPGGHHPAYGPARAGLTGLTGYAAVAGSADGVPAPARPGERGPASVLFAGAVADARPWYRAADLVVLPSRWEGMALAPLEAMACGRAVVVTDVDGAREGLPPALVPHCLVPPMDPEALADAVTGLLLDAPLRASLGRRGRAHVLSTHDVRHTAAAITAVYDDLLGDGRTTGTHTVPGGRPALVGRSAVVPIEYRESTHP
ncbi:glycosyltransferase [Streptomyces sp. NPDC058812]|uniref:glycosyltransferase n=1 Tax=unclassified Streptomyces TaxID=2593676 RepID=UPI0036ACBF0E